MRPNKDRVVAIDYFRGIAMLVLILSHSADFSHPYSILSGEGRLWTSAAEMFFLISGVTFGVVRDSRVRNGLKSVVRKSWHRALNLYLIQLVAVAASLALAAIFIAHNLYNDIPGAPASAHGLGLVGRILDLSYAPGWANFLMYYGAYLLLAPFALRLLFSRLWPLVPVASGLLYILSAPYPVHVISLGAYSYFATWQVYFFLGLTAARFRRQLIGWFLGLPKKIRTIAATIIVSLTATLLVISAVISYSSHIIRWLKSSGLAASFLGRTYMHLINHQPSINSWLMINRQGILRPLVAGLTMLSAYLIYQTYKKPVLKFSGRYITAVGRHTLPLYIAQAFLIPLIAAIPLHRSILTDTALTVVLFASLWLLTKANLGQKRLLA